jgi:uncharacterized protein YndB with AHSA1/START domain
MTRIEESGVLPIGREAGFRYITDPRNWPAYWPGALSVDAPRWSVPGDRATVVMRLLGRPTALHMELDEVRPGELVVYRSSQRGLPDARHERRFAEAGDRLEYTLVTDYEPRRGLRGLYDRLIVARGVRSAMRRTLARLAEVLPGATLPGA